MREPIKPTKAKIQTKFLKRKREDTDIESLQLAVEQLDTKSELKTFAQLPLSSPTIAGLKACHFSELTDIQARAIPLALRGADILGAAKTGSGKTLAFVIPVLENLFRARRIGPDAGLAAMIISPTRELAVQIFDVLRQVGRHGHLFAAGLVVGGKSLREEREALGRMNIVVCTPGRMLQHLSQTSYLSVEELQMLVLDEADRIMDMGFQRDLDAIVEYLPRDRQTLLFSATQTKKVSDLARLSLRDPEYVSVHETAPTATPQSLQQNYVLTSLPDKLDTLWSFLQASKKSKIIVFFSSAKQVRFAYECFRRMQPGIPLLHLHGRQKQTARLEITSHFSSATKSCLFATDLAARGLDFPSVDWVVQVDCPEDADTYIHRVGRTARFDKGGRAVLFLDPSEEEGMLKRLEAKRVPIERINIRAKKQQSIKNQIQSLCFKEPEVKYLGQKAYISYVKCIHIQKDKEIFKLNELPLEEYSASLGLPGAPTVRFIKGESARNVKNAPRQHLSSDEDVGADGEGKPKATVRTKWDRIQNRVNQDVLTSHHRKLIEDASERGSGSEAEGPNPTDAHEDDGFLTVKRRIGIDEDLPAEALLVPIEEGMPTSTLAPSRTISIGGSATTSATTLTIDSKRREKQLRSKKQLAKLQAHGQRLLFDDDGRAHAVYELEDEAEFGARGGAAPAERERFLQLERERVGAADVDDRELDRAKRWERKLRRKERARIDAAADAEADADAAPAAVLVPYVQPATTRGALAERSENFDLDFDTDVDGDGDERERDNEQSAGARRPKARRGRHSAAAVDAPSGGTSAQLEDLERAAAGLFDDI